MGIFYHIHNDLDLATKCFKKAQMVDPEYPFSWLLEGLLVEYVGRENYNVLYSHAFEIGKWKHWEILYNIARVNLNDPSRQALFAIQKCAELQVPNCYIYNMYGLLLEKEANFGLACVQYGTGIKFASEEMKLIITENLARSLCSNSMFGESVQVYSEIIKNCRDKFVWAGYGVALFFNEQYSESFAAFESSLELAKGGHDSSYGHITILVSQVLFAMGGPEHLQLAKQQLAQWYLNLIAYKFILISYQQ